MTKDMDKCFPYFANQYGCSICIKVCPFNRRDDAAIKAQFDVQVAVNESAAADCRERIWAEDCLTDFGFV